MASDSVGQGDLAAIAELLETITLVRRDGGGTATPTAALCIASTIEEAAPSGGRVMRADATWLVELAGGEAAPMPGDALRDAAGDRWTVLAVDAIVALGRYRCATCNLQVAYGCCDRLDVERPQWQDNGGGPEIVGWDFIATAQPARLQPVAEALDEDASPPASVAQYTAWFAEPVAILAGDRLVADDGTRYVVTRFDQAERIDSLPRATGVRE